MSPLNLLVSTMKSLFDFQSWSQCKTAAQNLAYMGVDIAPAFGVDADSVCGCRNPQCSSTGKHPLFQEQPGLGSSVQHDIDQWWRQRPSANLLVHTGKRSRLVVLDVDLRGGGLDRFSKLAARLPEITATLKVRTGSGGLHFYYRSDSLWPSGADLLGLGLDLRGEAGFVIGPGSRHFSGGRYLVEGAAIGSQPIAALPARVEQHFYDELKSKRATSTA